MKNNLSTGLMQFSDKFETLQKTIATVCIISHSSIKFEYVSHLLSMIQHANCVYKPEALWEYDFTSNSWRW
jgi:hypothetical protein